VLRSYGWSTRLRQQFASCLTVDLAPARVIVQQRGLLQIASEAGVLAATLSGKFTHEAEPEGHPVAGDWVAAALRPQEGSATIHRLLPRKSAFVRRAAGPGGGAQVVAANVDLTLVVSSLNAELSLRRIERYLATAWASGSRPVIVLTKADLASDVLSSVAAVEAIAGGVPVLALSAVTGIGLDALAAMLEAGRTSVLLGSSGVGKSTLVNALSGEAAMKTAAIREDDARGRHTTTHRELVLLPGGALMLDTPGMRELGLWDSADGVTSAFADIEGFASACRFRDCRHEREPGCSVQAALVSGALNPARFASYVKLNRELAWLDRKEDPLARAAERKIWIRRTKNYRAKKKLRWDDE
jgi:ribosome biogenesis GTPase